VAKTQVQGTGPLHRARRQRGRRQQHEAHRYLQDDEAVPIADR
jgi:hypothetical protein